MQLNSSVQKTCVNMESVLVLLLVAMDPTVDQRYTEVNNSAGVWGRPAVAELIYFSLYDDRGRDGGADQNTGKIGGWRDGWRKRRGD